MKGLNSMKSVKGAKGFTLIELMIVVAIIGILAAVAVPQYQQYTKKANFTEVKNAIAGLKTAVDICYAENGSITDCDTLAKVGETAPSASTNVASVTLTATTAAIVATASTNGSLNSETYTLTPTVSGGRLTWAATCSDTTLC